MLRKICLLFLSLWLFLSFQTSLRAQVPSLRVVADTNLVLPPAWAFGIVYGGYTNQHQTRELIEQIIQHDYPIDGFWIDSWIWDWENKGVGPKKYMDFVGDTASYPDLGQLWDFMQKNHIKAGMWVWNCIFQSGNEEVYREFKSKGLFSDEYIETNSWHNGSRTTIIGDSSQVAKGTWCGNIDFDNPEAVRLFRNYMKPFFDSGLDFVKLDRTDAISTCKAIFEMTQDLGLETHGRGFLLSHSAGRQTEEYKRYPAKWTDDTRSDWTAKEPTRTFSPWLPHVGLKENVAKYVDTSKSTRHIPFLANDMGGFALSVDLQVEEELFIRWMEFSCLLPLTTPFSQPENPTGNIPFLVSEQADSLFRKYAHLKMKLFPYIYSQAHRMRLEGKHILLPIPGSFYQYLLGDALLIAPVYEKGQTSRPVELPAECDWIDFWTENRYAGGQSIQALAPLGQLPIFIRSGAVLPMRKYASSIEAGTNDVLEIHIYPGSSSSNLLEDDGTSNDYLTGGYASTHLTQDIRKNGFLVKANSTIGSYYGQSPNRTWELVLHSNTPPQRTRLNGKKVTLERTGNQYRLVPFCRSVKKSWRFRVKSE